VRGGRWFLSGLGMSKGGLKHDCEGRPLPVAATQSVATELEASAERGQLVESGMTGRAGLSGLPRVERQRSRRPRREASAKQRGEHDHGKYATAAGRCYSQSWWKPSNHLDAYGLGWGTLRCENAAGSLRFDRAFDDLAGIRRLELDTFVATLVGFRVILVID